MIASRPALVPNLSLACLLCAIVASWAYMVPADSAVRGGYLLLALTTMGLAAVALMRPPARSRDGRWWVCLVCATSMAYALGYRFDAENTFLQVIFWGRLLFQFVAGLALLSLGKSYALLPALREVRRGYLYNYVRHPVYALYMLADLTVILLAPSAWNLAVAALGATAFCLRARLEENVLCRDPGYTHYMRIVRWRFFPGVH
jgi:protein-S-isoprenylcysteine O-methyltransferase Ste14